MDNEGSASFSKFQMKKDSLLSEVSFAGSQVSHDEAEPPLSDLPFCLPCCHEAAALMERRQIREEPALGRAWIPDDANIDVETQGDALFCFLLDTSKKQDAF